MCWWPSESWAAVSASRSWLVASRGTPRLAVVSVLRPVLERGLDVVGAYFQPPGKGGVWHGKGGGEVALSQCGRVKVACIVGAWVKVVVVGRAASCARGPLGRLRAQRL